MAAWRNWRETARVLTRLGKRHRSRFALVVVLTVVAAGADLVEPLVYRVAVNDVAGLFVRSAYERAGQSEHPRADTTRAHERHEVAARTPEQVVINLFWAVTILFFVNVSARVLHQFADNTTARASNRVESDLIQQTFAHVLRLPLTFFSRRSTGQLAKRIDQSDQVSPILDSLAADIGPEAIRLVGVIAIMISQNWELTLVALVTLPVYLWTAQLSAKKLETNLSAYYDLWEDVSSRIQDAVGAVKTVKLSGAEDREVARLSTTMARAYETFLARNRMENRFATAQVVLVQIGRAVVLGWGGYKVFQHQLTPGDVVMFVAYLDMLYDPIDSLTSTIAELQQESASVVRAAKLLAAPGEEAAGKPLADGPGRVEFRDVVFGYVPGRDVLRKLTFAAEAGKVTAIVGPSGAGKTTTIDLMLKLFEPSSGAILVDGQDLHDVDASSLRASVSVVSADGAMFRGTLDFNLRYKRPDAPDEDLRGAIEGAGLTRLVERLPKGLETEIGEKGVGLSVGERQRVQIARAIVAKPRVLVLDEATANLDYSTEAKFKAALAKLQHGRTTIVIAHRYAMVRDADYVVVIDEGRVREQGTPAELLAAGGWFAAFAGAGAEGRGAAPQSEPAPPAVPTTPDEEAGEAGTPADGEEEEGDEEEEGGDEEEGDEEEGGDEEEEGDEDEEGDDDAEDDDEESPS